MSDDSAVPHILLVDEKFHRLNRDLKSYRRRGSSKVKWEEKREEMRHSLRMCRNKINDPKLAVLLCQQF